MSEELDIPKLHEELEQAKADVAAALGWDVAEPWESALAQIRSGVIAKRRAEEAEEALRDAEALSNELWKGLEQNTLLTRLRLSDRVVTMARLADKWATGLSDPAQAYTAEVLFKQWTGPLREAIAAYDAALGQQ